VHSSWGIAVLCATFVFGVWLALLLRVPIWVGVAALPLVAACFWRLRVYVLPIVAVGGLCIGLGYGSAALGERDIYKTYIGKVIQLSGRVKEDQVKVVQVSCRYSSTKLLLVAKSFPEVY